MDPADARRDLRECPWWLYPKYAAIARRRQGRHRSPPEEAAGAVLGGVARSEGAKNRAQGARPGESVFLVSDFALPCRSVLRCRCAALQELEDAAS
jgi:hypothetical protein